MGFSAYKQNLIDLSPSIRAALLGIVFPGAGFIACANIAGSVALLVTLAILPVTLFAVSGLRDLNSIFSLTCAVVRSRGNCISYTLVDTCCRRRILCGWYYRI